MPKQSLPEITARLAAHPSSVGWKHECWYSAHWEVPGYSWGVCGMTLQKAREQCETWRKGERPAGFKTYITRRDTITRFMRVNNEGGSDA